MCILIWRGRFCVIDEALDSNQLVIGAQLLNNAFIRPCDVFNGSPLQCKYVWSALMGKPRENGSSHCDIAAQYALFTLNWLVRKPMHRSSYKLLSWLLCSSPCDPWKELVFMFLFCLISLFSTCLPTCQLVTSCNNQQYLSALTGTTSGQFC